VDNLNISDPAGGDFYIAPSGPDSGGPQILTLGTNVTVHGGADIFSYYTGDALINNGTINADNDYRIDISVDNFTNNGTAEATNGDTLNIDSTNWTNSSTGSISASGTNSTSARSPMARLT
jgi:hypothetical protein